MIVATGAALRTLDVPGADRLAGRGVSQCAWCDGGLYRDAEVVVAGGGDAALSEAIHLGQFARAVTIVTRGETFRARRSYVSRIADDERFRLRWSSEIVEVLGSDGVEGVRVRDREAGNEEVIACSGLFVFVGLVPNAGCWDPTWRATRAASWSPTRPSRQPRPACSRLAPCVRATAAG